MVHHSLLNEFFRISQFKSDDISLGQLIDDLNSLLSQLTCVDEIWKNSFKSEWWTIEQVHAFTLDCGKLFISQENQTMIEDALNNLKRMIRNAKEHIEQSVS